MHAIDLALLGAYLTAVIWLGISVGAGQQSVREYFLSGQHVPWWAVLGSIVATETSTVTLISVPGYAFGGDLTFLQLAFGYAVARVLVALVLVPAFFHGRLLTAYQLLATRCGPAVGRVAAAIFLATRTLSDGFRLFATSIVLVAVLATSPSATTLATAWLPGLTADTALIVTAIVGISVATLVYTLLGGMRAVIWTDVAQLSVYLTGAAVAAVILLGEIPGGWAEVVSTAGAAGKLRLFDFGVDLTRSYTFWSGVLGGVFLTAATHGTDQMFVQRYLCSRSIGDARRALVVSGLVIIVQFAGFLILGTMLWVYYTGYAPGALVSLTVDGVVQTDRILPAFMMTHLPIGVRGLVVAAVVAAAMSTLSSSLNSSAASTIGDFYLPWTGGARSDRHYLRMSRWTTVWWGGLQLGVALAAIGLSTRVVDEVLGIQSFTGGLILGAFLLALSRCRSSRPPIVGIVCGGVGLLAVRLLTDVSWQWYAVIGSLLTFGVGLLVTRLSAPGVEPDAL